MVCVFSSFCFRLFVRGANFDFDEIENLISLDSGPYLAWDTKACNKRQPTELLHEELGSEAFSCAAEDIRCQGEKEKNWGCGAPPVHQPRGSCEG